MMDVDAAVADVAAAIGEPARARMLFALMDGRARTATELAALAGIGAPTASVHLGRLRAARLVQVLVQGKHRYYALENARVGAALEALSLAAGQPRDQFVPKAPNRLRAARTCYDHMAGTIAVSLHDRLIAMKWLTTGTAGEAAYTLTALGDRGCRSLGMDIDRLHTLRRRFAVACLDWSERRPHLGGALGAALLNLALTKKWVVQNLDSRALDITRLGRREMDSRFGVRH